jgi:2'-5' RNA ligase
MPRLVVVLPLWPLHAGDSFAVEEWPLHITVLPPFHTDADPAAVAAVIASVHVPDTPVIVTAGHDEMFGRRENIPVTIINDSEALTLLHRDLIEAVRPLAAVPDEPAFTGREFRPHVTVKGESRVHEGDRLTLTQIALVDMAPRASTNGRTVLCAHDFASTTPVAKVQGAPVS